MRWTLGFGNPNHAATICAMAVCFGVALLAENKSGRARWSGILLAGIGAWLLAMTGSRGGMAAMIGGMVIMALVSRQGRFWVINALVWIELVLISAWLAPLGQRLAGESLSTGLTERLAVWKGACLLAWQGGFGGVGDFGNAYNLFHEIRSTNKFWNVALGDPQTLCVNHGWWASGLWVAVTFFLFATGWQVGKREWCAKGWSLMGCSVVWLIASVASDHSHPPCFVLLPAIAIFITLLVWNLYRQKLVWRTVWCFSLVGLLVGTLIIPLIGWSIARQQSVQINLRRTGEVKWWEVVSASGELLPKIILAAPSRNASVGMFARKMAAHGYSLAIVQNPTPPLTVSRWMMEQAGTDAGLLAGATQYAAAAIMARRLINRDIPLITWGGPLDNPVLDRHFQDISTQLVEYWLVLWSKMDDDTLSYAYYEKNKGQYAAWLAISNLAINSWQLGEGVAIEARQVLINWQQRNTVHHSAH